MQVLDAGQFLQCLVQIIRVIGYIINAYLSH